MCALVYLKCVFVCVYSCVSASVGGNGAIYIYILCERFYVFKAPCVVLNVGRVRATRLGVAWFAIILSFVVGAFVYSAEDVSRPYI